MKKFLNKNLVGFLALSLLIGFMFTACSSDDDGDSNKENVIFTVKAGDRTYSYKYLTGNTLLDYDKHPFGTVTIGATSNGSDYGAYNGAVLSMTYYLQGEGEYAIVRGSEAFITAADTKVMVVSLHVGTGNSERRCLYEMAGGKAIVKVVDGKYHITIEGPSTGIPTVTVGEGFAESASLLTYDVYDKD